MIRIADNGTGMLRDDALLAFERHATSKLRVAADLFAIGTLGFRGEALLSIGDTALRHRARPSFDLQTEYFAVFQRGFVYALWVYRKGLQNELEGILDAAKAIYNQNAGAFRKVAVQRFGFPEAFTEDYLTRIIRHELTAERRSDLEFFAQKAGFNPAS